MARLREGRKAAALILRGYAVRNGCIDSACAACSVQKKAVTTVMGRLDPRQNGRDRIAGAGWGNEYPSAVIIANKRIRNQEVARSVRQKVDAVAGEVTYDAVLNGQCSADIELNSGEAGPGSLDGQPAQVNCVAWAGIDGNTDAAWRRQHAYNAYTVIHDTDGLGDRERPIARRIKDVDLTTRIGLRQGASERPAWLRTSAGIGVATPA